VCYQKDGSGVEKSLDISHLSVYWNCTEEGDLPSRNEDSQALLVSAFIHMQLKMVTREITGRGR